MQVIEQRIAGLKLITPRLFVDERGFFFESYRKTLYESAGLITDFVQDSVSVSHNKYSSCLHFQSSPGQAKLVTCVQGKIWDVAVDIRP